MTEQTTFKSEVPELIRTDPKLKALNGLEYTLITRDPKTDKIAFSKKLTIKGEDEFKVETTFNPETGKQKSVKRFKNGLLDGISEDYDDNGNVINQIEYKNDKKNGLCTTFESEIKINELFYVDDLPHGQETRYNSKTGIKCETLIWVNGSKQGECLCFREDGTIEKKINFNKNILDGPVIAYYPNGKICTSYSYKEGKLHGQYMHLNSDGTCRSVHHYDNNEKVTPIPTAAEPIKEVKAEPLRYFGIKIKDKVEIGLQGLEHIEKDGFHFYVFPEVDGVITGYKKKMGILEFICSEAEPVSGPLDKF